MAGILICIWIRSFEINTVFLNSLVNGYKIARRLKYLTAWWTPVSVH